MRLSLDAETAATGFVLAMAGAVVALLSPVALQFLIICPICGFRPYIHRPLVRGAALREIAACPRCGGNPSADLDPLKTEWSLWSAFVALLAIWLLIFVLPNIVAQRGIGP